MGAPGCPEFACCTASIARGRIVLLHSASSCLPVAKVCSLTAMETLPFEGASLTDAGESAVLPGNVFRNGEAPRRLSSVYQFLLSCVAGPPSLRELSRAFRRDPIQVCAEIERLALSGESPSFRKLFLVAGS